MELFMQCLLIFKSTHRIAFLILSILTSLSTLYPMQNNPELQSLLENFKDYKTSDIQQHSGDLYEQSIWVANTIASWWQEGSFWVEGIDPQFVTITILAGLLHDIGFAGDLVYFFKEKKKHPEVGYEYLLEARPYLKDPAGNTLEVKKLFDSLNVSEKNRALLAILAGVHLDFLEMILKPFSQKNKYSLFKSYLDKLQEIARQTDYGPVDDQLVRMALLLNAANLYGRNPVNYCGISICFPEVIAPRQTKINLYQKYNMNTFGKKIRDELLTFYSTKFAPQQLAPVGFPIPLKVYSPGQLRTQTEAHLGFKYIQDLVMELYGPQVRKYKKLIEAMINKEQDLLDSHYVFYHGLASQWYVLQDIIKELYQLFYPTTVISREFYALRLPRASLFDKYSNVDEFLKDQISSYSEVHDTPSQKQEEFNRKKKEGPIDWDVPTKILSVNLALFGNIGKDTLSECTFNYFVANVAHKGINISAVLKKNLEDMPIPKDRIDEYAEKLNELTEIVKADEGGIYQIFIPKDKVDKYVYFARNFGAPYGNPLLMNYLFNREITKSERMKIFWALLMKNPELALGSGPETTSNLLERYRHRPETIPNINRLQARILFTNDMMLSPASGIRIVRYTTLPRYKVRKYRKKLKEITLSIFSDSLKSYKKP